MISNRLWLCMSLVSLSAACVLDNGDDDDGGGGGEAADATGDEDEESSGADPSAADSTSDDPTGVGSTDEGTSNADPSSDTASGSTPGELVGSWLSNGSTTTQALAFDAGGNYEYGILTVDGCYQVFVGQAGVVEFDGDTFTLVPASATYTTDDCGVVTSEPYSVDSSTFAWWLDEADLLNVEYDGVITAYSRE